MTQEYNARVHTLAKVGLLGLAYGLNDEAAAIFGFLRNLLADPAVLDISRAMILLVRGEADAAVALLRDGTLNEFPDHDMAKASLGMVLQMGGHDGWRNLYGQVLATSFDVEARQIAFEGLRAQ
jgi:Bacterial type III secretion protein (HrpB1_HrpK)